MVPHPLSSFSNTSDPEEQTNNSTPLQTWKTLQPFVISKKITFVFWDKNKHCHFLADMYANYVIARFHNTIFINL